MGVLITEEYRQLQAQMHAAGGYGTAGATYGRFIAELIQRSGAKSLLDYGCGKQRSLLRTLRLPPGVAYAGYDPAVAQYAADPEPADLVCCIDVLEHIEPEFLGNVLDHLGELCRGHGLFTVHTGPARKVLADGRNAHLTQQSQDWWLQRLQRRFGVVACRPQPNGFLVIVKGRSAPAGTPVDLAGAFAVLDAPEESLMAKLSRAARGFFKS